MNAFFIGLVYAYPKTLLCNFCRTFDMMPNHYYARGFLRFCPRTPRRDATAFICNLRTCPFRLCIYQPSYYLPAHQLLRFASLVITMPHPDKNTAPCAHLPIVLCCHTGSARCVLPAFWTVSSPTSLFWFPHHTVFCSPLSMVSTLPP